MASNTPKEQNDSLRNGGFKRLKAAHGLAAAELLLAALSLGFAIVLIPVGEAAGFVPVGPVGAGILAGVLGILSGGLGIGAFRSGGHHHKCLLTSHFVMAIIAIVLNFFLTAICIMTVIALHAFTQSDYGYPYSAHSGGGMSAALAVTYIILLASLAHMICSIVSCAFTCGHWCGGGRPTETSVVYSPKPESDADSGSTASVEVKSLGQKTPVKDAVRVRNV